MRAGAEPVLNVGAHGGGVLLASFGFGAGMPASLSDTGTVEQWRAPGTAAFRIEQLELSGASDIHTATAAAYAEMLRRVRASAHPFLLRIWNFFPGINAGKGDAERYRQFCVGRQAASDAAFHRPPPAATAIGTRGSDVLRLIALCGAEPGVAFENPRQTPAWRYPREYGPVAPGFSRGVLLGQGAQSVFLASGTASIVGHLSQHVGDVRAQLEESFCNLHALLDEAKSSRHYPFEWMDCQSLRVYLRRSKDLPAARAVVVGQGVDVSRVRFLRGDICRRELDVEIEGVFATR